MQESHDCQWYRCYDEAGLVQARLTIPVMLVTLAVTPPILLQTADLDPKLGSQAPSRKPQLPPWQVLAYRRATSWRSVVWEIDWFQ